MSFTKGNIAWVDVETDSLDASTGHLLEIAVVVTDAELNILDEEGFHAVVKYTLSEKSLMILKTVPVVVEMHQKTGLWDKIIDPETATPLTRVDFLLSEYLRRFGESGTMPVAGNSVRLDMNFMDKHLPLTAGFLDYHMRDVSTVAGLASDWYDLPWFEKTSDHTAKHDIRESIRELKHYREAIFRNPQEDRDLIAAYDVAGQMPQGTMTADQWRTFAGLYNVVGRIVDRIESHGTLTHTPVFPAVKDVWPTDGMSDAEMAGEVSETTKTPEEIAGEVWGDLRPDYRMDKDVFTLAVESAIGRDREQRGEL